VRPAWSAAALLLSVLAPAPARAFPPYRSTDADVADPWTLEGRLGLLKYVRDEGENSYTTPLLRLNLGIPPSFEAVSEFEYSATDGQVEDAALGLKWVPLRARFSLGTEVLALLPISAEGGAGTQALLLATYRDAGVRIHLNGGGFYDARPVAEELGWRASLLGELELGRLRPGLELFAARVNDEPARVAAGTGAIVDVGIFDVRAGVHVGVTDAAEDLRTSLWISKALALTGEPEVEGSTE
jgi:hypothetical protein